MKWILAIIMTAALSLSGCAGLIGGKPETRADYFCTNEEGYTDPCPRDRDIAVVIQVEEEIGADVNYIWLDYRHHAMASNVFVPEIEGNYCTIMWFEDLNIAASEDPDVFGTTQFRRPPMNIECDDLDATLKEQLTPEYHKQIDEAHKNGQME